MWLPISSRIRSQNLSTNPSFLNPKVFYMSWKYPSVVIELAVLFTVSFSTRKLSKEGRPWTYNNTLLLLLLCKNTHQFWFHLLIYCLYILNYSHSKAYNTLSNFCWKLDYCQWMQGRWSQDFHRLLDLVWMPKLQLMMITLLTLGWSILGY